MVTVIRATTDSGAVYEFLGDFSKVRRVTSSQEEGVIERVMLSCDDEWLRIVPIDGVVSPASLDDIRIGFRLFITWEQPYDLSKASRYTTALVAVESSDKDMNYIFS